MDSLLKITEFDDLNQINFALGTTVSKYEKIIDEGSMSKYVIEDAKRQLVIFKRLKNKSSMAINEYLKR